MQKLTLAAISLAICSSSVGAIPIVQNVAIGPGTNLSATGPIYSTSFSGGPNPVATRSLEFNQFNADTGVLTGATSGLNITAGLLQLSAQGTRGAGSTHTFSSTGSVAASSNLAGLPTFGTINGPLTNSCSNCPSGNNLSANSSLNRNDSSWVSTAATVPATSLNSYVGGSSLVSTLSLTKTVTHSAVGITNARAELDLTGVNGNQSLTYNYLNHANASFTSGLDTNVWTQDVSAGAFGFSIFNLGLPSDTTNLDSVSYSCVSGNCADFDLDLLSFQDLVAGNSFNGSVDLGTNVAGTYLATYALLFSDDTSLGATSTHRQNTLFLNVNASVVPEPGTLALLLAGLGVLGIGGRSRKQQPIN